MKAYIDNKLIRRIAQNSVENGKNILLEACIHEGVLTEGEHIQLILRWPSLLEYLDLGSLFDDFITFDVQNQLFFYLTTALTQGADKELLLHLYDQIFVECLTHIKALPQIHPKFLIDRIQQKRQSPSYSSINELFSPSLDHYEYSLTDNPANTMHDLILYLAWDRVCVHLAIVFENVDQNPNIRNGLEVLKECLLESFQHITSQGKTLPGFFRLVETLYAYQMREEYLQTYTDSEWLILCEGSRALKPRESLGDLLYIDAAVVHDQELNETPKEFLKMFTLEVVEKVNASLSLADYMIEQLKRDDPRWRYNLRPVEIICLREFQGSLFVRQVVRH